MQTSTFTTILSSPRRAAKPNAEAGTHPQDGQAIKRHSIVCGAYQTTGCVEQTLACNAAAESFDAQSHHPAKGSKVTFSPCTVELESAGYLWIHHDTGKNEGQTRNDARILRQTADPVDTAHKYELQSASQLQHKLQQINKSQVLHYVHHHVTNITVTAPLLNFIYLDASGLALGASSFP